MRDNERRIFEQFIELRPDFAGRAVTWQPGSDPPDVLCAGDGLRIGVELAEWVDEWQIANGKADERLDESFETAIRVTDLPPLATVGEIIMVVNRTLPKAETAQFREEFFAFLSRLDADWPNLEGATDPRGLDVKEFPGFTVLEKYVAGLECYGANTRPVSPGTQWVSLHGSGAAYEPSEAVDSLMTVFRKKLAKYRGLRAAERLDELYLLLFYDQGWTYNTPFQGGDFGFADVAQQLQAAAASEHGEFDKIFLFDPIVTASVEQVWP